MLAGRRLVSSRLCVCFDRRQKWEGQSKQGNETQDTKGQKSTILGRRLHWIFLQWIVSLLSRFAVQFSKGIAPKCGGNKKTQNPVTSLAIMVFVAAAEEEKKKKGGGGEEEEEKKMDEEEKKKQESEEKKIKKARALKKRVYMSSSEHFSQKPPNVGAGTWDVWHREEAQRPLHETMRLVEARLVRHEPGRSMPS